MRPTDSAIIGAVNLFVYFKGDTNAKIILTLRNVGDTADIFTSNEISPNPNDDGVVNVGTLSNIENWENVVIENTGTETALFAGLDITPSDNSSRPRDYDFSGAEIIIPEYTRPFTSIPLQFKKVRRFK